MCWYNLRFQKLSEAEGMEEGLDQDALMQTAQPIYQNLLFHFLDQVRAWRIDSVIKIKT